MNNKVVVGIAALASAGLASVCCIGPLALTGLGLGWLGIRFAAFKDRLYEDLGLIKYTIVISLYLMMMGVLAKIVLRLLFGIKYLFSLPSFNFNI